MENKEKEKIRKKEVITNKKSQLRSLGIFSLLTIVLVVFIFMIFQVRAWSDDGTTTQTLTDCGTLNTTNGVYTLANNITLDGGGMYKA